MNELLIALRTGKQSLWDHITLQLTVKLKWLWVSHLNFLEAYLFTNLEETEHVQVNSCLFVCLFVFQREINISHWRETILFVISEWVALCSAVVGIFTEDELKTEPRIVEEAVLAWIIKRHLTQFCSHTTDLWSVSSFLILLTTPCCWGKTLSSGHSIKSWPETHLPHLRSWQS